MKAVKITLVILVIAGISYFVWQSLATVEEKEVITEVENQFRNRIENEIDSLKHLPHSYFCGEFYNNIQFRIDDWHNQKLLGENDHSNDQWHDILSRNLYSVYAPKFIEQAFFVFRGSDWECSKRKFISEESDELLQSAYLEQGSSIGKKLQEIQDILMRYNEIQEFTNNLNEYIDSQPFEFEASQAWLDSVIVIRNNRMGNEYVSNCRNFQVALESAPQRAYNKHLNFVRSKVFAKSGAYKTGIYKGTNWAQKTADYRHKVYAIVKREISLLQDSAYETYGIALNADFWTMKDTWDKELEDAMQYFQNQSYN